MRYLKTIWTHDHEDSEGFRWPTEIFAEVDDDRWEIRKVEFYRSSPPAYGSEKDFRAWQSFLAEKPYPPMEEIENDDVLQIHEIPKAEFEAVWMRVRLEARRASGEGSAISNKLDAIDEFESKLGNREAVKRAGDLMVSYLAEATKLLPPVAAHAARAAIDYKNGSTSLASLDAGREAIRDFLRDHARWDTYDDPEICACRAVYAALGGYIDPSWEGGASELVSCFWEATAKFDSDEDRFLQLFRKYFL